MAPQPKKDTSTLIVHIHYFLRICAFLRYDDTYTVDVLASFQTNDKGHQP